MASFYRRHGKRLLDLALTIPVALVAAPVMMGAGAAIRATMGSPVFFRHRRPGLHGQPFVLLKFRTMKDAVGKDGQPLSDGERLTGLGRFLRRTSLDELPTVINVLRGEMSLVGPRPLLMEYLGRYSEEHARRHLVKPGITGLAQVEGRHTSKFSERLARDVAYVDQCSLPLDVKILLKTALQVFVHQSAVEEQMGTAELLDDVGLYLRDGQPISFARDIHDVPAGKLRGANGG